MSKAEIMREVAGWPVERQNELAAFLLHLRIEKAPEWRTERARRIDDTDPSNWVPLSELKKSALREC